MENVPTFTFDKYPSYSQSVERHVRLVSQISSVSSSPEEKDVRIIHVTFLERKLRSRFSSKQNFLRNTYFFNQRLFCFNKYMNLFNCYSFSFNQILS